MDFLQGKSESRSATRLAIEAMAEPDVPCLEMSGLGAFCAEVLARWPDSMQRVIASREPPDSSAANESVYLA
ncbi:hypothetical protein J7E70_13540 [Variovorax paradoxus]|nr:hypothetical protein [Variovorax paradoxus]MBT2301485.1 hypothetical protein [Variovorax paradoxus]